MTLGGRRNLAGQRCNHPERLAMVAVDPRERLDSSSYAVTAADEAGDACPHLSL